MAQRKPTAPREEPSIYKLRIMTLLDKRFEELEKLHNLATGAEILVLAQAIDVMQGLE